MTGFAGGAVVAAVEDEEVGEGNPVLFGDDGHEILFNFDGVGVSG